jgi:hypothetical protein
VDQRSATLDQTYTWTNDGSGVVVYIVDSGIRISHQDFGGRASYGVDLVGGGLADDCHGHGTHMAGTVGGSYFGVAKGVSLVAVRVLDCTGQGTVTNVIAGLDWVASHHAPLSIANLSFSTGYHSVLNQAVANTMARRCHRRGLRRRRRHKRLRRVLVFAGQRDGRPHGRRLETDLRRPTIWRISRPLAGASTFSRRDTRSRPRGLE